MSEIQEIVDEYFRKHGVDVDQMIINYKIKNRVKLLDDSDSTEFILGANLAKLYLKELMIK